jgi:hypothetical protein
MVTKERAVIDARLKDLRVVRSPLLSPPRVDNRSERRSLHPFIAWIPLAGALLLPLLRALLLCLLLGTAPLPVVALFLIHLALVIYGVLVWGGLVGVWPSAPAE